ncbi:MAG: NUDIX domain-containing protein [Elusimicrobiota bacterium]|jgi:tRNA nucleotidyltransferase (CCA-adding enzyme)|nr:NUDIX domain-containing protein [Elusimicrobiota bacterium]
MREEFSCGAIVYRIENNKPLFILVYSKRNGHWGFPKGHIEKSDKDFYATAAREIFEETGIKEIKFCDNFRHEEIYLIGAKKDITKHTIFFLACADQKSNFSNAADEEIGEVKELYFEDAVKLLKFDSHKMILNKALEIIEKGG